MRYRRETSRDTGPTLRHVDALVAPPRLVAMTPAPSPHPAIALARDVLGLSYRETAQALGVHESTLRRWRRGQMPTAVHLDDLARLEALIREVEKSVRPGAVKRWLNRPSRIFAGEVPRHLVVQRRGAFLLERLREAIARFTL